MRERATLPWLRLEPWVRSPRHVAGAARVIGSVCVLHRRVDGSASCSPSLSSWSRCFALFGVRSGALDLIAAITTMVIHYAFYKLLRVPLPWGVLTQLRLVADIGSRSLQAFSMVFEPVHHHGDGAARRCSACSSAPCRA